MKNSSVAVRALLLSMSVACVPAFAQAPSSPAAASQAVKGTPGPDEVIARVNGKPVPYSRVKTLMEFATRQRGAPTDPAQLAALETRVRDEAVRREILTQEAVRRGLSLTPKYMDQITLARESILARELYNDEEAKITDADVQAEYAKVKAERKESEVRARHILVAKEDLAKSLIAQLKAGANFDDLARKHSTDEGSARKGGDLDWASPGSYVPEFAKALGTLNKGEVTPTPVKTSFGFHVIRVDDIREFPELATIAPQIRQHLAQQRRVVFEEELIKRSKTAYKFQPPEAPQVQMQPR